MGQNFLTGGAVIRRLVRRAKIRPGDHVIEIGAGKGHITRELLRVGAEVTAYELDRALAARLHERFAGDVLRKEFHPSPSCDAALLCIRRK